MKTGCKVGDAMTKSPIYVSPGDSLTEIARVMDNNHVGAVLVKDGEKLIGIITEQDMVRKGIKKGLDPSETVARQIVEEILHTVEPDTDLFDALKKMGDANVRHLPVIHNNQMVGLLTGKDILKIQPQLFEILVDKIELRETERKADLLPKEKEGICHTCGRYAEEVFLVKGSYVCDDCKRVV